MSSPDGGRAQPAAPAASLQVGDPLAHRALQALLRAESAVRRSVAAELERAGVSAAGFSAMVVLRIAGGSLELKTLRRRLGWSKANATEVTLTLEQHGMVTRRRSPEDRRSIVVELTAMGAEAVEGLFPDHSRRVSRAFSSLDDHEKRSLADICRKLAA